VEDVANVAVRVIQDEPRTMEGNMRVGDSQRLRWVRYQFTKDATLHHDKENLKISSQAMILNNS
jgi:hypothetical protein